MTDFFSMSARDLVKGYRARQFVPTEVVTCLLERIELVDVTVNAFVTLDADRALRDAGEADRRLRSSKPIRPLEGVPFAAKDLFDAADLRTTYGSRIFAEHLPSRDAVAVRLTRDAGGILIGKTNTHEFGWGITTNNPWFGATRNPWALARVPGGSSGGSAAALAALEIPLALGSDTGGSIRIPAAFCGVFGLKPTYGRIDSNGAMALAPSLDHPGPMARDPRDAALYYRALTCIPGAQQTVGADDSDIPRGLRIGTSEGFHPVPPTAAVVTALARVVECLLDLGAESHSLHLPDPAVLHDVFVTIQRVEALHTHRQAGLLPGREEEYGEDVRERFAAAAQVTLDEYLRAAASRELLRARFLRLFDEAELLLTPVSSSPPPYIGDEHVELSGVPWAFRELVMPHTTPQNLFGLPSCSMYAGVDESGIPIGVQLTAAPGREDLILNVAAALSDAGRLDRPAWPH